MHNSKPNPVTRFFAVIVLSLIVYSCGGPASKTDRPKAIFLIVVDTLRADRLSCYGYKKHQTRNIDRLATAGVLFKHNNAVSSWTRSSMGAMLTSCYPMQLGLVEKPGESGQFFKPREKRKQLSSRLPDYKKTLAELLSRHGYQTAAFVNQPSLNLKNGFERGFDDYYYPIASGEIVNMAENPERENKPVKQGWGSIDKAFRNDHILIGRFKKWINTNRGKNVFVWLHLLTPHRPYLPPNKYITRHGKNDKQIQSALYDGEILAADDMTGRITSAIDNAIGLDNALIIFTADHGEEFWEHGNQEHGHSLHREVIHVPLIISSGIFEGGVAIDDETGTVDIMPTILEIFNVSLPEKQMSMGKSLLPLLNGRKNHLERNGLFAEGMLYGPTRKSIIHDSFKLNYNEQERTFSLFNLKHDRQETQDLAQKKPNIVKQLRKKMMTLYSFLFKQYHTYWKKRSSTSQNSREQDLKAMESLGYL